DGCARLRQLAVHAVPRAHPREVRERLRRDPVAVPRRVPAPRRIRLAARWRRERARRHRRGLRRHHQGRHRSTHDRHARGLPAPGAPGRSARGRAHGARRPHRQRRRRRGPGRAGDGGRRRPRRLRVTPRRSEYSRVTYHAGGFAMSHVSRRHLLKTGAAAAAALAVGPFVPRHARGAEEITIGALCELSGPASTIGSQQALGIQFAVDEINKSGGVVGKGPGVGGRPLKVIIEDTESKVATGLAKAKKLVERDRVDVLTGIIFSAISLSVQEYVNRDARIPFLNAGSGNPAISEPPACGKYTFQALPNSRQLVLPSLYAARKHGAKWFFIADDYSWGKLSVQLTKDAVKLGSPLEVVGEEYSPLGTTNYAPYVTKAMAAKPDVLC